MIKMLIIGLISLILFDILIRLAPEKESFRTWAIPSFIRNDIYKITSLIINHIRRFRREIYYTNLAQSY